MSGRMLLAALITALGALIALVNLRNGLSFSVPLLLGVLLLADGVLRFMMITRDDDDAIAAGDNTPIIPAMGVADRAPLAAPAASDGVPHRPPLPSWEWDGDAVEQPAGTSHEPDTRLPQHDQDPDRPQPEVHPYPDDEAARPRPD